MSCTFCYFAENKQNFPSSKAPPFSIHPKHLEHEGISKNALPHVSYGKEVFILSQRYVLPEHTHMRTGNSTTHLLSTPRKERERERETRATKTSCTRKK